MTDNKQQGAGPGASDPPIYEAPRGPQLITSSPQIFMAGDADAFAQRIRKPLRPGQSEALVDGLNEAALSYFSVARREAGGNPSDFEQWSDRVAKTAAAFLRALGVDPCNQMPALPLSAYVALCSRPGSLTEARYPQGQDYMGALQAATMGAKVARDLASHAAAYYGDQKPPPEKAAKRGLSARQAFVIKLAETFEACFEIRFPSSPHAGESPFLRFAMKAFDIVKERTPQGGKPVTFPDDGADYAAAQLLAHASEQKLADDVRKVFPIYRRRVAERARGEPGKTIDHPRG